MKIHDKHLNHVAYLRRIGRDDLADTYEKGLIPTGAGTERAAQRDAQREAHRTALYEDMPEAPHSRQVRRHLAQRVISAPQPNESRYSKNRAARRQEARDERAVRVNARGDQYGKATKKGAIHIPRELRKRNALIVAEKESDQAAEALKAFGF